MWEALCILVALRLWSSHWLGCQCALTINSDNISALVMTSKLKITSSELIAQELALLLSEASYMPRHVVHVPGVLNAWADALSRLSDPSRKYMIPAELRDVPRAFPTRRSERFYSTLAAGDSRGEFRRVNRVGWVVSVRVSINSWRGFGLSMEYNGALVSVVSWCTFLFRLLRPRDDSAQDWPAAATTPGPPRAPEPLTGIVGRI